MKNSKYKLVFIFLFMIIILTHFWGSVVIGFTKSSWWHLTNKSYIQIGNAKINLPFRWWIMETGGDNGEIMLGAIPPYGYSYFGVVSFEKKYLGQSALEIMQKNAKLNGDSLNFIRREKLLINDREAIGFISKYVQSDKDLTGSIEEIWYFPADSLHIHAVYVSEDHRNIFLQLLNSIRFADDGSF